MYYVLLNDASMFEVEDIIEETTTKLKGETLKAISMNLVNADRDLIRSSFSSEFNTRTVKLLSEGKVTMTVYDNYTILRSIATDEEALTEGATNYTVILAQPSDIGTLVPQIQERLKEIENEVTEITANPDPTTMSLDELKTYLIAKSKTSLADYLLANPVSSTCHKGENALYACTQEKQSLLTSAIAMAQIHAQLGDDYKPSWNVSGGTCTYDWTLTELTQLAIEIEAAVKPQISGQQSMESAIKAATSIEEANAVSLVFPVVTQSTPTEA